MNILGTGLSGLVGSRIIDLFAGRYSFENLSLETGVDITNKEMVDVYFEKSKSPWVFHLAAYTDVQGAEKEREMGENGIAWKVNVLATEHIVENCKKYGKHLLYLDTDYAFDGSKKAYTEEDTPHPLGWYAKTKSEGAKKVSELGDKGLIFRISNPYRAFPVGKKDFVHKMLERLQTGQLITAPSDQVFAPTFIDDIVCAIEVLIPLDAHGVFHIVGSNPLSPFDAAMEIAHIYGLDTQFVKKTTFADMFRDRAPVPQYAALSNAKVTALGVTMRSFSEGVSEMKRQEDVKPQN